METLLPEPAAHLSMCSWLKVQMNAIMTGVHSKSPMMVLAGDVNDGKSFFMNLTTILRGGRDINPIALWSGRSAPWSDQLLGKECLNIDDSAAEKSYSSREQLGTRLKEAIFSDSVTIEKRHTTSFTPKPRPVWGVMMTVNSNQQSLRVVPALDEPGMDDKVILLRAEHADIYMRDAHDEGATERMNAYTAELPAFMHWLLNDFQLPESLPEGCGLTRSGVVLYRDNFVMRELHYESAPGRLEELIRQYLELNSDSETLLKEPFKVSDFIGKLADFSHGTGNYNDRRIPASHSLAGRYFGIIARREDSCVMEAGTDRNGTKLWLLRK